MLSKIREFFKRYIGMDVKDSRPSVVCVPEVAPPALPDVYEADLSRAPSGVLYDSHGKVCTQCGEYVRYSGYSINKKCVGGRQSWCRVCTAKYVKAYRARVAVAKNVAKEQP